MGYLSQRLGLTRYEADEYYSLALDAYQKGELDDAVDNVNFAITLLPTHSEYYAARGLFYLEDGLEDKARESFEEALKRHHGEVLANYGMGILAYRKQAWEEAIRWFHTARAVNPMQVEIPYYLALIYHRQQDNATAVMYMEQALQLMENSNDKRKVNARRWLREFEKLLKLQSRQNDDSPKQPELPLDTKAGDLSAGSPDATPDDDTRLSLTDGET